MASESDVRGQGIPIDDLLEVRAIDSRLKIQEIIRPYVANKFRSVYNTDTSFSVTDTTPWFGITRNVSTNVVTFAIEQEEVVGYTAIPAEITWTKFGAVAHISAIGEVSFLLSMLASSTGIVGNPIILFSMDLEHAWISIPLRVGVHAAGEIVGGSTDPRAIGVNPQEAFIAKLMTLDLSVSVDALNDWNLTVLRSLQFRGTEDYDWGGLLPADRSTVTFEKYLFTDDNLATFKGGLLNVYSGDKQIVWSNATTTRATPAEVYNATNIVSDRWVTPNDNIQQLPTARVARSASVQQISQGPRRRYKIVGIEDEIERVRQREQQFAEANARRIAALLEQVRAQAALEINIAVTVPPTIVNVDVNTSTGGAQSASVSGASSTAPYVNVSENAGESTSGSETADQS
jgi:hypothetical protein